MFLHYAEVQFVSYQAKQGKITAVASAKRDPLVAKASELIRLGLMPTLDQIRGGKVSPVHGLRLHGHPDTRLILVQDILTIDTTGA